MTIKFTGQISAHFSATSTVMKSYGAPSITKDGVEEIQMVDGHDHRPRDSAYSPRPRVSTWHRRLITTLIIQTYTLYTIFAVDM